jgi:hypothetical protein
MSDGPFSVYPLFLTAGKRARVLVVNRWGAIATGAFLLGLIGLPFFDQLDKADGLPRLLTPLIILALLLPPVGLIFMAYRGVRWFIHESGLEIQRASENSANVSSRRAVRVSQVLVSLVRASRLVVQNVGEGLFALGAMAVGLGAMLLGLLAFLFVVGGIIGLLVIGWNAL